jgi:acyl carrier protein
MWFSVDASQHRLNHKSLISPNFFSGQTLKSAIATQQSPRSVGGSKAARQPPHLARRHKRALSAASQCAIFRTVEYAYAGFWAMTVVSEALDQEEAKLARLIIETLNLELDIGELEPETPIYGEGMGLDSIDILEVALAVSQQYGVTLHADDENNTRIFASIRSLSEYIQANKIP